MLTPERERRVILCLSWTNSSSLDTHEDEWDIGSGRQAVREHSSINVLKKLSFHNTGLTSIGPDPKVKGEPVRGRDGGPYLHNMCLSGHADKLTDTERQRDAQVSCNRCQLGALTCLSRGREAAGRAEGNKGKQESQSKHTKQPPSS